MSRKRKKFLASIFSLFFGLLTRAFPLFLLIALFYFCFLYIRDYLYADPFFNLSQIEVTTDGILSREEILDLARLKEGENIFKLDLEAIDDLLESSPAIKRATVSRILRDKLKIKVEERKEFLQVRLTREGRFYIIDQAGYVLPKIYNTPRLDLILLKDETVKMPVLAPGNLYNQKSLALVKELLSLVRQNEFLRQAKITRIEIDHLRQISLYLDDSLELKLGTDFKQNWQQISKVTNLLTSDERKQIEYIDLRFEDILVKRKKKK